MLNPQRASNGGDADDNEGTKPASHQSPATKTIVDVGGKDPSTLELEELKEYIEMLQDKAQQLDEMQQAKEPKRYQVLYCIEDRESSQIYLDHPEWAQGGSSIRSRQPLYNLDLFLERNKDIAFLIYRTFDIVNPAANQIINSNTPSDCIKSANPDAPLPQSECIYLVARNLRLAVKKILKSKPEYNSFLQCYKTAGKIDAPYLFIYHGRQHWEKLLGRFSPKTQEQLKRFASYVFQHYGEEYTAAEALFSRRMVSPALMKYLFMAGDILVSRKSNEHLGYVTKSWPKFSFRMTEDRKASTGNGNGAAHSELSTAEPNPYLDVDSSDDDSSNQRTPFVPNLNKPANESDCCSIKAWRWGFDTTFKRQYEDLIIRFPRSKPDNSFHIRPIRIEELDVFPLRFATEELVEKLKHRGKMFWRCRERCLVSYIEQEGEVADNRVSSTE